MQDRNERVMQATQRWLERAVIGLNLCPFAKAVHVKGQIHYAVSRAVTPEDLLDDLRRELDALVAADPQERETTLLIAPSCMQDFLEFNDLLTRADRLLAQCGFEGEVQIANFHPHYQFAGTDVADITNFSNRSPYPTLHLLRESSIDRAVASFPQASAIFEANMATLRRLGPHGWASLGMDSA